MQTPRYFPGLVRLGGLSWGLLELPPLPLVPKEEL